MTLLQLMPDDAPDTVLLRTTDTTVIAKTLAGHGVELRHWPVRGPVTPQDDSDEILQRYRAEVDELSVRQCFRLVDVARLHPSDDPARSAQAAKARTTFLEEHRHAENEVRFFAHGRGCFYLHLDGQVFATVCEAGDLLSVPAGTRHWFDMGARPDFTAIRFFEEEDGWVGDFTGDPLARSFPTLDALVGTPEPAAP
ncbi:1,2-dihydroxy-3-keto-5-methylthiopentene dioxygenase [Streptomyces sp. NRRL S-337]|uniref:1,2-dihydroxy-3-keto-5-methylthiopentene dioxygenase n=1 Tax=Streptomyces sp. NRRL S-337 TaxID=1463900 RepID=UPI0004CAC6D5|nr:cupin [Streptomyces sp. NRRL S-337]